MKSVIDGAETRKAKWEQEVLEPTLKKSPERTGPFTTISGRPIERLYTAEDVAGIDYDAEIANPGEFPYVRGIHPSGYRGKLWTMRQFAGFGTPEETNQRYKQLLKAGGTGLSVAFDLPGLPVDTHVGRLSRRLGLTREEDPVKVEHELNRLVPPEERGRFSLRLILHGRRVCPARRPRCGECTLLDVCPEGSRAHPGAVA